MYHMLSLELKSVQVKSLSPDDSREQRLECWARVTAKAPSLVERSNVRLPLARLSASLFF